MYPAEAPTSAWYACAVPVIATTERSAEAIASFFMETTPLNIWLNLIHFLLQLLV